MRGRLKGSLDMARDAEIFNPKIWENLARAGEGMRRRRGQKKA